MSSQLPALAAEFVAAIRAWDEPGAASAYQALGRRVGEADRVELSAAAGVLAPFLTEVRLGDGAIVANVAGDLLHMGAAPTEVLAVLVERITAGLEQAATFPTGWEKATGESVAPDPDDRDRITDVAALLVDLEVKRACEAWYSIGDWVPGLLVPLQNKEIRVALPGRERLSAAAHATADLIGPAHWLLGLALVLDDAPLVVLHRETGRGFAVTIGGIGDNFQLHTLLAAALIGDGRLPGTPPDPTWVAAATAGDPQPEHGIEGRFTLVDAAGDWIWNEGRPADIPVVDGRRVVVLETPAFARSWNTGRVYPLMQPSLTVDAELSPAEAAAWFSDVRPGPPLS